MPETEQSPSEIGTLDFSKAASAGDPTAVERACQLIDSYIAEKWQSQMSRLPDKPEAA
jgi:hypothetical protein